MCAVTVRLCGPANPVRRAGLENEDGVSSEPAFDQHRFVVVWRREPREIEGAASEWRGWVARVPDPHRRDPTERREDRIAIRSLDDAAGAMRQLIDRTTDRPGQGGGQVG